MADLGIAQWIRGLEEGPAVDLAKGLLFAEAGRLGVPLEAVTMSRRVKVPDQGIDGRSEFPETSLLPSGPRIWQVKSSHSTPDPAKEFDESKHPALFEAMRDGWGYVLFWTFDPTDPKAATVRERFTKAVHLVNPAAEVSFLLASDIERLCLAHLGVLAQQSHIPLSGVVSLDLWSQKLGTEVEFKADDLRSHQLATIREHVQGSDRYDPALHIVGDTGVGKSRLVYEALAQPGLSERVLVAVEAAYFERSLLSSVAESEQRSLIIVVDDCNAENRRSLVQYAEMAMGRVRLVTIGARGSRRSDGDDSRYLYVRPLGVSASSEIAKSLGLDDRDADLVARFTEGYPGLARELSHAIRTDSSDRAIADRIRGQDALGHVLSGLLPPADSATLGVLALFERLGFDGDLAQELSLACEALGADEAQVRNVAEQELGRFVSDAGRYRRVTPRVFAAWLAMEYLHANQTEVQAALSELPKFLVDRVLDQMDSFAGDDQAASVIEALLDTSPFVSGTLGDVDAGAMQLLRVAALLAPLAAMATIEQIVGRSTAEGLHAFSGPARQDLVRALETLVWFESTFSGAADTLLALAMAETEDWSNNAAGTLQGCFQLYLGGTTVPFEQRLVWAQRAVESFGEPAARVLIPGLRRALDTHEMRTASDPEGLRLAEWRPATRADDAAARRGAWSLIMRIGELFPPLIEEVASAALAGLRTMVVVGFEQSAAADIRSLAWPDRWRGMLGESISRILREFEELEQALVDDLTETRDVLYGSSFHDRFAYLSSLAPWEIDSGDLRRRATEIPELEQLAEELSVGDRARILEVAHSGGDPQTVGAIFENVGRRIDDVTLLSDLLRQSPEPTSAVLGLFAGLAESRSDEWANGVLKEWLEQGHGSIVVQAVHGLDPTQERVDLLVEAADEGLLPPETLRRLLYGAWTSDLGADAVVAVASRLSKVGGPIDIEHALGLLDRWAADHAEGPIPQALERLAAVLIRQANDLGSALPGMGEYYRARLLLHLDFEPDLALSLLRQQYENMSSRLTQEDMKVFDEWARAEPRRVAELLRDLIVAEEGEFDRLSQMRLTSEALLSRLIAVSDSDVVRQILRGVEPAQWYRFVDHLDFFGSSPPEPLFWMLAQSTDDRLWNAAAFRFMFPKMGWSGRESEHIRSRLSDLDAWRETMADEERLLRWAGKVDHALSQRLDAAREREAEDEFY